MKKLKPFGLIIFTSNKARVVVSIFSLLSLCACIEDYPVVINQNNENALVVDGKITNLAGPYTIKLSTASSIEDQSFYPVENATVTIIDNEGNMENLSEIEPGKYQTSVTGMQGIVGRSYQLSIQTNAGKHYESDFEELLQPTGIESITSQIESRFAPDTWDPYNYTFVDYEDGYQLYLTTEDSDSEKYYYWELEETWEIRSYWKIKFIYGWWGNDHSRFTAPSNQDTLLNCWKTVNENFFTSSTNQYHAQKITNLPLNFIPINSERMKYKYSLLLHQYSISENTQLFFKALINQAKRQEGLYTEQPYQIKGNVYSINNPDEAVFGYFMAASTIVPIRHTIIKPPNMRSIWDLDCKNPVSYSRAKGLTIIDNNFRNKPELWPVYISETFFKDEYDNDVLLNFVPDPKCIDCTSRGATTIKPEYWDQEPSRHTL